MADYQRGLNRLKRTEPDTNVHYHATKRQLSELVLQPQNERVDFLVGSLNRPQYVNVTPHGSLAYRAAVYVHARVCRRLHGESEFLRCSA